MDDLYMMMGDDPLVYQSPPVIPSAEVEGKTGDVITNSTNQMLDVVSDKRQRKGNRRQNNSNNNNQRNRNRHRNNNNNNQNDGTSFDDNNPINVISAFNRTNKIYNKLRKNDAVKVIDTPSGRAGFVYQSSGINSNNQDFPMGPSVKESNTNWEDSYSQNQFVNRNANDVKLMPDDTSNKKIMPVLTSDGKIALVMRGDTSRYFDEVQNNGSGNSVSSKKYEPITNLTSIITALNSNNDNNINNKQNDSINLGEERLVTLQEQNRRINRLDEFFAQVTNKLKHIEEVVEHELGVDVDESTELEGETTVTSTTTTTEAPYKEDEHKKNLLQINRPLSEVLGLPKKTHYHHPQEPIQTSTSELPAIRTTESRRINTAHKTTLTEGVLTTETNEPEEFDQENSINIAVIPGFDSEMEERLFGKDRNNLDRNLNEVSTTSGAISSIHCAMQAMVAIACACTVFGVLGAYYKVEIVNQVRVFYW